MPTTIKLKNGSGAPTAGQLVQGEPAFDLTNKRLYTEDSGGTVIEVGVNPSNLTAGHNGSTKLTTTSTGIDVTGTVTADGLTVDGSLTDLLFGKQAFESNHFIANNFNPATSTVGNASYYTQAIEFNGTGSGNGVSVKTSSSVGIAPVERMRVDYLGDISFYEDTGTTAKFFWDASAESLGIGTSSPATRLDVAGGVNGTHATFSGQAGRGLVISTANTLSNDDGVVYNAQTSSGKHIWQTNSSEAMRIDSSGNLLVGTTSTVPASSSNVVGSSMLAIGKAEHSRDGGTVLSLNRKTSDGDIAEFRKDGTTVGSIGSADSGDRLYIANSNSGIAFDKTSGAVFPCNGSGSGSNAVLDIGSSVTRFKDLYLSGGVYLGGTGAANHLDDYEEGTFTPTLTAVTTNPSVTYTKQEGTYTKVGNLVYVTVDIRWSAQSGGAGNMQISNLPFAITTGYSGGVPFEHSNSISYNTATYDSFAFEGASGAYVTFVVSGSGVSTTGYSITTMGTGAGYVIFSFCYRTA